MTVTASAGSLRVNGPPPEFVVYTVDKIRHLHLEASTLCNAECPMCCRNLKGRTSPGLVETSMGLAMFSKVVTPSVLRQLEVVNICGAYGDPIVAPELLQIIEHIRRYSRSGVIRVFTNGGLRDERWWAELGSAGLATEVVFAIDGLTTNKVYRRRVKLDKVLNNARAFIAAGGRAQWDYIVFEHNEHEVEHARALSEELGFARFAIKRTARFLKPLYDSVPEVAGPDEIESFPIHDRAGSLVGELRPPRREEHVNEALVWMRQVEDKARYLDDFFDECDIQCLAVDTGSVFVSVGGLVYPCCWLYVQATLPDVYGTAFTGQQPQVRDLLQANGGPQSIDATRRPMAEIVGGAFFSAVERSWAAPSVTEGKLKVCARVCGKGFNAYQKQWVADQLVP